MAKRRSKKPKPLQPVYRNCIPCGKRFLAGYAGGVIVDGCPDCAAGLFRVLEQSETILVPLPATDPEDDGQRH